MGEALRLRTTAIWAGVLILGEVALYGLWPLIDDNDAAPSAEQQLAFAAAMLLLCFPHLLAYLARRDRPWLLRVGGSAGILLTLASVMGFSLIFVTIPLVFIPSVIYLMRGRSSAQPVIGTAGLFVIVALLTLAAVGAFFLTEDPRCSILVRRDGGLVYTEPAVCDPNNSGRLGGNVVGWSGSSDTIALHESLSSLALTGSAIALCLLTPARFNATQLESSMGTTR
jgi:hypothetical protein